MSAPLDFEKAFKKFALVDVMAAAKKGLARAGINVMNDAIQQVPKVPIDEGTLRGSGSVFVDNMLVATSEDLGQAAGTPAKSLGGSMAKRVNDLEAVIGFNTPYAKYLHEHPEFNFTEPGTGGKYLETKMATNKDAYMKTIVTTMRKELAKVTPTI